jgi:hypothetical protein
MPAADLPGRGERSAPNFDKARPEELGRFFAEVEDLFDKHNVVDNTERKQGAVKYIKVIIARLWKTAEAWANNTKTYEEFKAEIIGLYPGASDDVVYTIQDLDKIIDEYVRIGLLTTTELGDYYRQFLLVLCYLISKNRFTKSEQSRAFMRGFQLDLARDIQQRLQLKIPDHLPMDPYELSDIYAAATFVLMGSLPTTYRGSAYTPTTAAASSADIKIEALIPKLGEMIKTGFENQAQSNRSGPPGPPRPTRNSASVCNFCGVPGHFIRECEIVAEYTWLGKCKRNHEGKVVLPSGAMVPREISATGYVTE